LPIQTVPLDRLHSEVAHLQRQGHRVLGFAADPHKDSWHILYETDPRPETRGRLIRGNPTTATLIKGGER